MVLEKELRLSSYVIPVSLDAEPGKYMLVHGYTGAVDIVDGEILAQMSASDPSAGLTDKEISVLKERGYITDLSHEEELARVIKQAELLHGMNARLYRFFGFVITYNCNFRCPYCFENGISDSGKAWSKQVITPELVDKAFEAMYKIEPHKKLHIEEIILYGGEPLLRENHSIVEYIVRKGTPMGYKFRAITNGYDLDYYEDLLSQGFFNSFQISLDGFREHNNENKYHYREGGGFDKVISNIRLSLKYGVRVSLRVNLDENNIGDFKVLKEYLEKDGILGHPLFSMYPARIFNYGVSSKDNKLRYLSREEFECSLGKNRDGFDFDIDSIVVRALTYTLKNKTHFRLNSTVCPAQYSTCMFGPDGKIYTCLEKVGDLRHAIGTYSNGTAEWSDAKDNWFSRHVGNMLPCQKCKYALLCGGTCITKSKLTDKGFTDFKCRGYNKSFAKSVNAAYSRFINNKN